MNFEAFEQQVHMYLVGALEELELAEFLAARRRHGARAEEAIAQSRRLRTALALSLSPHHPKESVRDRLLAQVKRGQRPPPPSTEDQSY